MYCHILRSSIQRPEYSEKCKINIREKDSPYVRKMKLEKKEKLEVDDISRRYLKKEYHISSSFPIVIIFPNQILQYSLPPIPSLK